MDSAGPGLYNAALFTKAPVRGPGAQVAQLVEHAIENRSVGGSIPPLGTILMFISLYLNHLAFEIVPLS